MVTLKEALEKMTNHLMLFSTTARLDVELLASHVLHQSRAELFTHSEKVLSEKELNAIKILLDRRISQEPLAYIVGHKEFWDLDLKVDPAVLIPRPETEMLVEWALTHLPQAQSLQIADLGTGSGAVALAIAKERPRWYIDATDNSSKALKVAKENAEKHSIKNVNFYLGEWCHPLPHKDYHAIVGNPPYIKEDDDHLLLLTRHEPRAALVSGPDGLQAIRHIVIEARNYLLPGGWLALEHGYDQHDSVIKLFEEFGYQEIKDHEDLARHPRMIIGRR